VATISILGKANDLHTVDFLGGLFAFAAKAEKIDVIPSVGERFCLSADPRIAEIMGIGEHADVGQESNPWIGEDKAKRLFSSFFLWRLLNWISLGVSERKIAKNISMATAVTDENSIH
jgi:hypothetical protein